MLEKFLPRQEFSSYDDFKANYKLTIPENFNYAFDVVDAWAREQDDKPALHWIDDEDNEKKFSFGDIMRLSNQTAHFLKAQGIKKGDCVMMLLRQRPEVWVLMMALCKIGAVCIPASYLLSEKDIVYRCEAASVKLLMAVDEDEVASHVKAAKPHCTSLTGVWWVGEDVQGNDFRRAIAAYPTTFERPTGEEAVNIHDPMLIFFTSGTTGMPRMAWHDFTHPIGHITTAKYWHEVQEGTLHLTASDSGWAKFGWGKIYGQWICGAVIAAYDTQKFVPQKMLHVIEKLKLTTFCAPPTVYRFLIQEDLTQYDFSTIKKCTIAGEPLNPEVFYQWKNMTGLELTEGFGQSETTVFIANFPWDEIKPGSTGKPAPIYDFDIIDEHGRTCEDGVVGAIVIKNTDKQHPTGLFYGYYRDAQATEKCWKDGVYNTGDVAWRDGDGYIWFVGRGDDVIKCSGYRIGPFEVESALMEHAAVMECAVTAAPDPVRGQVVKATIVLAKGFEGSDELKKELQNHVKTSTAPYKYPRIVEFVTELPKTTSGKIRRVELRNGDQ